VRRQRARRAAPGLDGLAWQAHLLALDAAVVAARGGPGQAPTSQARQVRELAEQLGQTAAEIEALIAAGPDRQA
jgi:methyl-accepting chemotaxis protein